MSNQRYDANKPLQPGATLIVSSNRSTMDLLAPGAPSAEIKDQVTKAPDVEGRKGKAWLSDLVATRAAIGIEASKDGTVCHWIIEAPWAHPAWHSYALVCVHLRPMADGRPTKMYLPDASHEMWLFALDPDADRNSIIAGVPGWSKWWLQPKNFAAQFIEASDGQAMIRIQSAVDLICRGLLSPDVDFMANWIELFGGNMLKDGAWQ